MRILIPFSYYHPEQCAGLFVVDDMTEEAARQGISSLITVPTPTRNVEPEAKWNRNETLRDGMVQIHRFHMYGEGKNPVLRALRYLFCEIVQMHYMLWKEYDVAFIDSTPPIQGLKLPIVRLFRKKPIVYNLQDIFPDSLVGTGLVKKGNWLWKIGRVVEKITYRYSDKIIGISEDFKRNLLAKGVPAEKIEVVYNWVDEKAVVGIPRGQNKLFAKYDLDPSKFYITYSGNIGLTQNMDMLLEVMNDLKTETPDIMLVLIGEGAYKQQVERTVSEKQLTNVRLLPYQPFEDLSYVFSLGNAGLIISKPGVGANSVPSKTWNIMSASRPVLANFDENELKTIIETNSCGIFTKAGDKESFKKSILKLYHESGLCEEYGKNGRQFVMDHLTKEVGSKKYVEIIKSVVKN